MSYIGKTTDGFGVRDRFVYVVSAGATSVSGADANGATLKFTDGAYVDVYLNGVLLKPTTDYNTSTANTIAGISAMTVSDEVTVIVYDVFTVADTVSATSGGTFNGDVSLPDNVKARFGADGDLQIFHNVNNSVVRDNGTGSLSLQSNGADVNVWDHANTQYMADFNTAGSVDLYHNGSKKFETTSAGALITGSLDMNGGEVILDADADTSITADTDDQIDFKVGGTDKMRIDATGRLQIGTDGNLDRTRLVTQRTTGIGTSATVIASVGTVSSFGGHYFVTGRDANSSANRFCDQLVVGTNGSVVVLHSSTVRGGPHSRTYDNGSENLRVTMGGGSYTIQVFCIDQLTS